MDSNAANFNVTIDDFDSILSYPDQSQWTTPDPSPSSSPAVNNSPWLRGTYHNTTVKGAEVAFNFTGPAIYIYGSVGPAYGSYQVVIDNQSTLNGSAYRENAVGGPALLFSTPALTYADHHIVLRNLGKTDALGDKGGDAMLFDYALATAQLAPSGATVKNVTYEETDPAIKYTGTWGNNTGPVFSGGGTKYTSQDGGSFEFTFQGSALYVLGDKKNDHRAYTVTLDSLPPVTYNGTSACGGAFGLTCEQQLPCIKYLATNLAEGSHTVKLVNNAKGPGQTFDSFFDLDSIVVTVPSKYAPRQLTTGANSPFVSPPSASTISGGSVPVSTASAGGNGGTSSKPSAAPDSLPMMTNTLLLLVLAVLMALRPWGELRR